MCHKPAPPARESGRFLALTANGIGAVLVKPEALRVAAFEEKTGPQGNRRMTMI